MITIEKKLNVLIKVAELLNKNNINWAIGASLLLYFKGIAEEFHDIDIMVDESGVEIVKKILLSLGTLQPENPNMKYKTNHFLEFKIDDVDFDVMAGFVIVKDNKEYYFPLQKKSIKDYISIDSVTIPLQSIEEWRTYYELMGRAEKVKMINEAIS
ncbi:MAG: hypothetical protein E7C49_02480 [Clostridium sp.]|nr:hypothetical protein [Clostridium sp.]